MISLFGMILVDSVDDCILIAENIYAHFEKGKSAKQAAIDGTMEVLPSVCSSVITTIVAFSVLFFVEGLEMIEMAFVTIGCLIFSILEGFITLPSHLRKKYVLNANPKMPYWTGIGFIIIGVILIIWNLFICIRKSFDGYFISDCNDSIRIDYRF